MLTTPEHFAGVLVRGIRAERGGQPRPGRPAAAPAVSSSSIAASPCRCRRAAARPCSCPASSSAASWRASSACTSAMRSASSRRSAPARAACRASRSFVVVGEFDSGMPEYDAGLAYVSLADAQRLYEMGDAVTGIEVRGERSLPRRRDRRGTSRAALGSGYRVRDWMAGEPQPVLGARAAEDGVLHRPAAHRPGGRLHRLATLIMVVMEKRKDIAILKSMGAPRAGIGAHLHLQGPGHRRARHAARQPRRLRRLLAAQALPVHRAAEGRVLRLHRAGEDVPAVLRRRHRRRRWRSACWRRSTRPARRRASRRSTSSGTSDEELGAE